MPYTPRRIPQLIAHRGDTGAAPDNSVAAIRAAAALGVDMIEFDICASADGAPVVVHGPRLERWSTGTGRVVDQDVAQLVTHRLRDRNGEVVHAETIPTLAEALDAAGATAVNCDIKDPAIVDAVVAELLDRSMGDRAVLSGLTPRQARRTQRRHGDRMAVLVNLDRLDAVVGRWRRARTGWLLRRHGRLFRHGIVGLNVPHRWVDAALVRGVHRLGGTIWVFTVDDQARVDELVAMGVDSITTNRPGDIVVPAGPSASS
ncbi:MAG: glycerophosphodiester phosphodiesterase [Acidimicrobiales bacterium]